MSETNSENIFDSDLSALDVPGFESAEAPAEVVEPATEDVEVAAAPEATEDVPEKAPAPEDVPDKDSILATPAAKEAAAAAGKVLKFTVEGKEVPVPDTAVVPWKVDGKTEMVPVKDLLNNYAGNCL